MKDGFKGVLLDVDRRSRESVPSRQAGSSKDWVALGDRSDREEEDSDGGSGRQSWLRPLPLWLAAFHAGRLSLLRAAEGRRRRLFREPVRLSRFLAIGYTLPPSSLLAELAWLRELGVRQVVLPLDQDASDMRQGKALAAIQNLCSEDIRVGAVLRQKRGAEAEPEIWHQFCYWILSQVGWQLERAQLGEGLDEHVRERRQVQEFARLFAHLPRLRRDYPGVALLAPGVERFDAARPLQALRKLLPDGYAWDGVTIRMPAWQLLESVGQDDVFLRRLTLAGAIAGRAETPGGKVQIGFPPPPPGCDADAAERVAASVVRRTVLALTSGVADRVVVGMDPASRMEDRSLLSAAIREMMDQLEGARFVRRERVGNADRDFVLEFTRTGRPPVLVGWTDGEPRQVAVPFRVGTASDYLRRHVPMVPHPRIRLTRNMAYFVGGNSQ